MTIPLLAINYALMIAIPIVLAIFIRRRTAAPWRFFLIGAATFILSQVGHIPFNALVQGTGVLPSLATTAGLITTALFLGLSAGVFEEVARYLTYRFWAKDARSWSRGLMLGAGHGGIEAILLGALTAINTFAVIFTTGNEMAMNALPPEQRQLLTDAATQVMSLPTPMLLLGAVERLLAVICHLAMSLLVLQVFLRRNIGWLFLSIAFHTALNMAAVIGIGSTLIGPYWTEVVLGLFALLAVVIIFRLRSPEPVEPEPPVLPPPADAGTLDLAPSAEAIDRSRYS